MHPESSVLINGNLLPTPLVDGDMNIRAKVPGAPRVGTLQIVDEGGAGNTYSCHAVSQRAIAVQLPKEASVDVSLLDASSDNAHTAPVDRHGNSVVESLGDCVYVVVGPRSSDQVITLAALMPVKDIGEGEVNVTSTLSALTLLPFVALGRISLPEACAVQDSIAATLRGSPLEKKIRSDLASVGGLSIPGDAAFETALRTASLTVSEWLSARRPPGGEAPVGQR